MPNVRPDENLLTTRQREVLDYIICFHRQHQRSPTRQMVANHFGFKSKHASQAHFQALAKKGWISITPKTACGIRVLYIPQIDVDN